MGVGDGDEIWSQNDLRHKKLATRLENGGSSCCPLKHIPGPLLSRPLPVLQAGYGWESSSLHHRKWYWHLESTLQGDGSGDSDGHYDSFVCWVYAGRRSQMRPKHLVISKWAISAQELKITDQSKLPLL